MILDEERGQLPFEWTDTSVVVTFAQPLSLGDTVDFTVVYRGEESRDGFFFDDRPDTNNTGCMKNCKDPASVEITSEPAIATLQVEESVAIVEVTPEGGEKVYQQACLLCHGAGVAGSPMTGDTAAWSARIAQGRDKLLSNAINGIGVMPPKGGQIQLSDEEVASAVDYMIEQATQD